MELPRSILPYGGIPKSRIGKDFYAPAKPLWGQPAGLPHFAGRVLLTDNFEHLIQTADGRQVLCHVHCFEAVKQDRGSSGRRPVKQKKEKGPSLAERLAAEFE